MTRAAEFASAGTRTFKNVIIGGDFTTNPWQRGTSSTPAVSSTTWLADRWLIASLMSTGQFLNRSTTDVPTADEAGVAATLAYELAASVAEASPGAGAYYGLQQRIEGYNIAHLGFGKAGTRYLTLSFWHKHTKTGTYSVTFRNSAGNRSYAAEYTQSVTNTWEKAEITIPVDTTGTWLYDNGIGLQVYFAFVTGTNYQGTPGAWAAANYLGSTNQVNALDSLSNYCRIALVQLEAGPEATEFEARDVGTELALCQRYYCKSYTQGTNPGTAK
jgi:hypothetical protein